MATESTTDGIAAPVEEAVASAAPLPEQLSDVQWVYDHFADDPDSLEDEAPSRGALGLLQAAKADKRTYLAILERVHPKDAGLEAQDSASQLLDLDARIQKDWGVVADTLQLAATRPEFVEPLAAFTSAWKREHPKLTAQQQQNLERNTSNVIEPDEVPAR